VKISQYCSVCKQSLEMEVVPTDKRDDDGVIWLRCPQCQGFLPRISGDGLGPVATSDEDSTRGDASVAEEADPGSDIVQESAAPSAAEPREKADTKRRGGSGRDETAAAGAATEADRARREEELRRYATELAEKDPATAAPYRPWNTYVLGDLIHHLAWDDIGLVVNKRNLPGNRQIVEVYFEEKGVVRLIEADSRKP